MIDAAFENDHPSGLEGRLSAEVVTALDEGRWVDPMVITESF